MTEKERIWASDDLSFPSAWEAACEKEHIWVPDGFSGLLDGKIAGVSSNIIASWYETDHKDLLNTLADTDRWPNSEFQAANCTFIEIDDRANPGATMVVAILTMEGFLAQAMMLRGKCDHCFNAIYDDLVRARKKLDDEQDITCDLDLTECDRPWTGIEIQSLLEAYTKATEVAAGFVADHGSADRNDIKATRAAAANLIRNLTGVDFDEIMKDRRQKN